MEPRDPGGSSILPPRRRNPLASSLRVPQPRFRSELWPKSVWPGALLVNGELVGTWRRHLGRVTVRAWRPLEPEVTEAVEDEVSSMPIESATKEVCWSTGDVPR